MSSDRHSNVKGLVDPRNKDALGYIMARIRDAGYHADYHVINSYDYGVLQNRVRIYIIGFLDKRRFDQFSLPPKEKKHARLGDLLGIKIHGKGNYRKITKSEACLLQGFPADYKLPDSRARWMKLVGNSVSVPVIETLCRAIIATGVFEADEWPKMTQTSSECKLAASA